MEKYEKLYKEALERAREFVCKDNVEVAEYIFPELKESEDEKIRKELLNYLYDVHDDDEDRARWLAWLEKQREQKPAAWSDGDEKMFEHIIAKATLHFSSINYLDEEEINFLKSLRPQNNITDEELAQAKKDAYNDALGKIEYHSSEPTFDDGWSAAIWYLKKRNARPQSQWMPSDEQMKALNYVVNLMASSERPTENDLYYNILKSLRQQLKKHYL